MAPDASTLRRTVISDLKEALLEFLDGPNRNQYICDSDSIVNVYTRKGLHHINGMVEHTLDIAAISVTHECRSNGIGAGVINMMHACNPFGITFVESLLNESLYTHLKASGWKDVEHSTPPCVYLETQHERTMRPLYRTD